MKYIIDIDGTICTPVLNGNYEEANPISSRIEKINKLSIISEEHSVDLFSAAILNHSQISSEKV